MRRKAGAQALAFGRCPCVLAVWVCYGTCACHPSGSWVRSWDTVDDVPAVYRGYVLVVRYAGVMSRYTVPTGSSYTVPALVEERCCVSVSDSTALQP